MPIWANRSNPPSVMGTAGISRFTFHRKPRHWRRRAGLPVNSGFGEFYRDFEWMGLQRHLKVLGIFARICHRDGKPAYVQDSPRFLSYVRAVAGRYAPLAPLLRLLDQLADRKPAIGYTF